MNSLWYIIISVALAVAVFEGIRIAIHIRKAIALGKKAVPVSRHVPDASMRILVIGDSTALGTGATDPSHTFAGRLAQEFPHASITNAAENAMTFKRLVEKLRTIPTGSHTLVLFQVGGMDTLQFTPLKIIQNRLREAFEHAHRIGNGNVVAVSVNNTGALPVFRFPLNIIYGRRSRRISMLYEALCRETGSIHVPLWEEAEADVLRKGGHYAPDGMHPNDEGYGLWYDKIRRWL